MKKILVIGQDGMLGGELYERLCACDKYEVYKTTIETLNICDKDAVIDEVKKINPYFTLNLPVYFTIIIFF